MKALFAHLGVRPVATTLETYAQFARQDLQVNREIAKRAVWTRNSQPRRAPMIL